MTCPICHHRLGTVSTLRFHGRQVHIDCLSATNQQPDAIANRAEYGHACACRRCNAIRTHYGMAPVLVEVPA